MGIAGLTLMFYGIFHARKVYAKKTEANLTISPDKSAKPKIPLTPKSFLKKCVKCGKEIPIASEHCPYCMQKQP